MTNRAFTDFFVEQAARTWLQAIGWRITLRFGIASYIPMFRQRDQREVTLVQRPWDTLLPKLISGELRLPDVEKFIEEVGI